MAIASGGHVRVGLEDSIFLDAKGERLATNALLVERIASLARTLGREPATPAEAREIIGLNPR